MGRLVSAFASVVLLVCCQSSPTGSRPADEVLLRSTGALQEEPSTATLEKTSSGFVPAFPAGADVRVTTSIAARAGRWSAVTDKASGLSVRMRLLGTRDVAGQVSGGSVIFPGAFGNFDMLIRAGERDLEDFVVFPRAPPEERLTWELELGADVAGLRLIENTLEFLDAAGAPRLRVGPVRIVDAGGKPHDAQPALEGCAVDRAPVAPWQRPVTAPGARLCHLTWTWSHVPYPAVFDPSWTTTLGTLNDRHSGPHTVLLTTTGKVLAAGGISSASPLTPLNTAELYDENTGTWARTGNMTLARSNGAIAWTTAQGGRAVVAGGDATTTSVESYNPASGLWTAATTGLSVSGLVLNINVTLADGRVLILGGQYGSGCGDLRSVLAFIYDPATDAVAPTGSMSWGRVVHQAVLLPDGRVLAAGGEGGCCTAACLPDTNSTELWSPATGQWVPGPDMLRARSVFAIEPLGGNRFLFAGGLTAGFSSSVPYSEVYTFVPGGIGAFSTDRSMLTHGGGHEFMTTLPNGKVLSAGAWMPSPASVRDVVIYDPAADSWANETMLSVDRRGHAQVRTAQGRSLVVGGISATNVVYNSSELYDAVALGAGCGGPGVCASGFCVDGVCCNTACSGTCQRCDVAGQLGTCTAAPLSTSPRAPGCAGNLVCDGSSQTCPTLCTSNQTCTTATFCNAGTCTPKRPNGQGCQAGTDCTTGFCADGFCCDTACNGGGCDACSVVGGSTANGTCTLFAAGAAGNPVCAPYLCTGTTAGCPSGCLADPDCVSGRFCNGATCEPKLPSGQGCARAEQCTSNFCVDGVCCNTLCNGGACDVCNSAGAMGTCTVLSAGLQGSPSCAPYLCDGASAQCATRCSSTAGCVSGATCTSGVCAITTVLPLGQTCTLDTQCASGHCTDGACCNTACPGACEVCNGSGSTGTCTPRSRGAAGTTCAPFTCDGTSGTCPGTCAADADCATGAFCVKGVCSTQQRGQVGFGCGCGAIDGPALWALLGLVGLSTRRARSAR